MILKMKGIVNFLKPPGMTSFDVVYQCRHLFGIKKIGHAGTLDRGAAGVLAVCVGRGTKVVPFLTETTKSYRAEAQLGVETNTLDAFGEVTNKVSEFKVSKEEVEEILDEFRGEILQVPPMYSAIKKDGQRLYKLAQQGKKVERKPRKITIYKLQLLEFNDDKLLLDIECSKGTYIRSLIFDIGKKLGMGAYMSFLVRTRVGDFNLNQAVTLEELQYFKVKGRLEDALYPLDEGLKDLPKIIVKSEMDIPITNGVFLRANEIKNELDCNLEVGDFFRVYNSKEEFIAVYEWSEEGLFKPKRVFHG